VNVRGGNAPAGTGCISEQADKFPALLSGVSSSVQQLHALWPMTLLC